MVAFHYHFLPRGGHILLEDDIAVQQVVHLQLQVEVLVQAISGAEVQRVQRLLPDIAQTRHAYRMDAAALQVVEQGEVELPVFAEAWRVGEVGIGKDGRCALQRTFLVGVGTALGQLHVGVHVTDVGA